MRTVTVYAGAYASVRAIEKAQEIWGATVTVRGIINDLNDRDWIYEVVDRKEWTVASASRQPTFGNAPRIKQT